MECSIHYTLHIVLIPSLVYILVGVKVTQTIKTRFNLCILFIPYIYELFCRRNLERCVDCLGNSAPELADVLSIIKCTWIWVLILWPWIRKWWKRGCLHINVESFDNWSNRNITTCWIKQDILFERINNWREITQNVGKYNVLSCM